MATYDYCEKHAVFYPESVPLECPACTLERIDCRSTKDIEQELEVLRARVNYLEDIIQKGLLVYRQVII